MSKYDEEPAYTYTDVPALIEENERLRDALLGIVGLPDVHAKELEIAVDALAALDGEVGE